MKRFFDLRSWKVWVLFEYYILKLLRKTSVYSNKLQLRIRKMNTYVEQSKGKKLIYKDLTPTENFEENKVYIDSLDWALSQKNILNIALTGPYGSGKSSILKTYKSNRPHHNYLSLSVATFHAYVDSQKNEGKQEEHSIEDTGKIKDLGEAEIEKRILQQLFYKVNSRKAAFGRFRRIKHVKTSDIIKGALFVSCTIVLGVLLFAPELGVDIWKDVSDNYLELEKLNLSINQVRLGYLLLSILLVKLLYSTIELFFRNVRLSRLKIKDTELDMNKEDSESVFNKYLDEILYFFQVNPYNVVIVEDLDRFNDIGIFMKLRELNALINNSEEINRKVVFVYAIKDDLFRNKDRTKFFDFILPVIPIINSTNAGDIFWKEIEENALSGELSESFISDICIFINDMRILNNIFNEYVMYRGKLMNSEDSFLEPQRMFAMMVYKNIYPNDFAKLQFEEGYVYNIFQKKEQVVKEYIKRLSKEVEALEKQLKGINDELLESEKELKLIYWNEATAYNGKIYDITVGSTTYTLSQILADGFDISVIKGSIVYRYYYDSYNMNSSRKEMNEEKRLELLGRLNNVRQKSKQSQAEIMKKIDKLKSKTIDTQSWNLKTAIEEIGIEHFISDTNSENSLIRFILRNGYIDETYPNYINYFYEGSLTHQDMVFLMKLKDQVSLMPTHPLTKIEKVIEKLHLKEFERQEVLNFNLVNYLLDHKDKYVDQLHVLMGQLSNEGDKSFLFIDTFMIVVNDKNTFIRWLCSRWHNIWLNIYNKHDINEQRLQEYLESILMYADNSDIKKMNEKSYLSDYIAALPTFLECFPAEYINKIKKIIEILQIKFYKLELRDWSSKDLLDFIIENNHYRLNFHMVKLVVMYKSNVDEYALHTSHLTTLRSINYQPLWQNIYNNLAEYVADVVLKLDMNVESEEIIIELMNIDRELLPEALKEKMIKYHVNFITDINSIPTCLWNVAIVNNRMKASWYNVLSVYLEYKILGDEIITYLNNPKNYVVLSGERINEYPVFEESIYEEFSKAIIVSEKITRETFIKISESLPCRYSDFETEVLSTERLKDAIESGFIDFTADNFNSIRGHHKQALPFFIERNLETLLGDSSQYTVDGQDIFNLLSYNHISVINKTLIIEKFKDSITCTSAIYANTLCSYLNKSRKPIEIAETLLRDILKQNISVEIKIALIMNQKEYLGYDMLRDLLEYLGEPYRGFTEFRSRHKLTATNYNREFVELLKQHKVISSTSEIKGTIRVIAKYPGAKLNN